MGGQETEGIKLFGATITLHNDKQGLIIKQDHQNGTKNVSDSINTRFEDCKRPDKIIPCPRCKSMDTKFCYFNNYNVNQPRHFCKGCQRYWTAGGALRNVPVGAGRRKTKLLDRGSYSVLGGGLINEGCNNLFDGSSAVDHDKFGLDSMVLEEWHVGDHDGYRQDFPVKRRRSGSGCESC